MAKGSSRAVLIVPEAGLGAGTGRGHLPVPQPIWFCASEPRGSPFPQLQPLPPRRNPFLAFFLVTVGSRNP